MVTFITPYYGQSELTASNGLVVITPGLWRFSQQGYNDGATFGLSMTYPSPESGGELYLRAQDWNIPGGTSLTSYTDPDTHITYPSSSCRITITGRWVVIRQQNSNSFNGFGVEYGGRTSTDAGDRDMGPYLLNYEGPLSTYIIQGSGVQGGEQNTFSNHVFECRITETSSSDNSNREYQSNTIVRPVWAYTWSRSWQV